jgi:post-segregation antitoxin (ccd killing protein)
MFSVDTLSADLVGEINVDRNASGGTVPERFKSVVRGALRTLWTKRDWVWQLRVGSLAISAAASTATLATDFRKMDSRWLKDNEKYGWLQFTNSLYGWQEVQSQYSSTVTGQPEYAVITRNMTDHVNFLWYVHLTPTADQAYTYSYSYLARCPLDLAVDHADYKADSGEIPMEEFFSEGWRLLATVRLKKRFGTGEAWLLDQKLFGDWYEQAVEENNETISDNIEQIVDGYGDMAALESPGCGYSTLDFANLPGI